MKERLKPSNAFWCFWATDSGLSYQYIHTVRVYVCTHACVMLSMYTYQNKSVVIINYQCKHFVFTKWGHFWERKNKSKIVATNRLKLKMWSQADFTLLPKLCHSLSHWMSSSGRAYSTHTTSLESFWVFLCCFLLAKLGLTCGMLVKCPAINRSNSAFHRVAMKVICKCGR